MVRKPWKRTVVRRAQVCVVGSTGQQRNHAPTIHHSLWRSLLLLFGTTASHVRACAAAGYGTCLLGRLERQGNCCSSRSALP